MNAKKHKRRATKLSQKVDRGSQNRRAAEGKSNIAVKRVTLLPGFLINGFTSKTVQKAKGLEKKNPLNDDLQAYLDQRGKHPRRSQRILKKHIEQCSVAGSKTSSYNCCENPNLGPTNVTLTSVDNMPNNFSFRSILKNNSKSLFKDISDRFSKVNIHNTEAVSEKPVDSQQRNHSEDRNFEDLEEMVNRRNQNLQYVGRHGFEEALPQETHQNLFRIELNRSFCRNLEKQISVTFKKNAANECRENIRKEIETVNMKLEGRTLIEEMIVPDSEDNNSRADSKDGPTSKFYPVPAQNWIYNTPPNQKIGAPRIEECQLQAGVLCHNKSKQNLYEVKPSFNVKQVENVPIDDRFMKKVAQVRKTPANFGFRGYNGENMMLNGIKQSWREPVGCGDSAELSGPKEPFLNPNFVPIITRPTKLPKNPIFPNFLGENMPTPRVLDNVNQNITELQDFTFIQEGNDFKMQESQQAPEQQRHKRRLSEEEFVIKRRNMFITEPLSCDKEKMFNFGNQERNIFNFGNV